MLLQLVGVRSNWQHKAYVGVLTRSDFSLGRRADSFARARAQQKDSARVSNSACVIHMVLVSRAAIGTMDLARAMPRGAAQSLATPRAVPCNLPSRVTVAVCAFFPALRQLPCFLGAYPTARRRRKLYASVWLIVGGTCNVIAMAEHSYT